MKIAEIARDKDSIALLRQNYKSTIYTIGKIRVRLILEKECKFLERNLRYDSRQIITFMIKKTI